MAAKTPTPAANRAAVLATGVALLALIAASTEPAAGVLMLTEAEGSDIIASGDATVDLSGADAATMTAPVSLTDKGRATLAAASTTSEAPATAPAASSGFDIDDGVPMPATSAGRQRSGGYPFDKLGVGQSFHVPPTAEHPKPVERLASSVHGARMKYAVESGEFEDKPVKTYKKTEDGKDFVKDADGKRVVESTTTEKRPKMTIVRDFQIFAVGADDPRGPGARVFRTK